MTAPSFAAEEKPVFFFGERGTPEGVVPGAGSFKLAREIRLSSSINSDGEGRLRRPMYRVMAADPVTTRVLQLWRPTGHESLARWIDEFIKLRPLDPLLCWLVVMRAVAVVDVLNALGEYGWSSLHPFPGQLTDRAGDLNVPPARIRLEDVSGSLPEFRRRVEWALVECESVYGCEWLDRLDASVLLSACEAAHDAGRAST